jgi:hypothetical protein
MRPGDSALPLQAKAAEVSNRPDENPAGRDLVSYAAVMQRFAIAGPG